MLQVISPGYIAKREFVGNAISNILVFGLYENSKPGKLEKRKKEERRKVEQIRRIAFSPVVANTHPSPPDLIISHYLQRRKEQNRTKEKKYYRLRTLKHTKKKSESRL